MKFRRQYLYFVTQNRYQSKMEVSISGLRKQCKNKDEAFLEKDLASKEPIGQFKAWYDEVCAAKQVLFPGAMCLATVSREGFPSARYVICTSFSKDGFKFFTDYSSRKSKEMDTNPNVAATFYWAACDRSIRIEGHAEKLPDEESTEAFKSRPLDVQAAVWASSQSIPIESKSLLGERQNELREKFLAEKEVPKPNYWGGYIIRPSAVEFWQAQSNRLSDRIRFRRPEHGEIPDGKLLHAGEDGWVYERLSP
ncbi:pyridoxine/pyridoxamine 5'-phosphate oxidase-like [Leguminivora glycinivorella]|uniref:pyridoxine/pyridoxamine 5'-phosphate oxidase-like n=1 Tax=Leguminivora glycinivorella TaxID=1035111 RepID=UPI00200D77E8|nr:pyridoxine/pyridoxamine 5'-phosphate oxidase-like [Leguminivora glycinivorella]